MAFAKDAGHLNASDLGEDPGVGACRLNHNHFGGNAILAVNQVDVLGARAVDHQKDGRDAKAIRPTKGLKSGRAKKA